MQIPDTPLRFLAGLLATPPAGRRPAIDAARPAKAPVQTPPAKRTTVAAGLAALGSAETLDQAVQALRAQGRLPRRGSLLDITA